MKVSVRPVLVLSAITLITGYLVMSGFDSVVAQRVGLGVWWFGALLFIDCGVLRRNGLGAQFLWGIGIWVGSYVMFYTGLPHAFTGGVATWIAAIVTGILATLAYVFRPPPEPAFGELLLEMKAQVTRAARPAHTADYPAAITRLQLGLANAIADLHGQHPREAAELAKLLAQYKATHGNDTLETSSRPVALRNAVTLLVEDMASVDRRLTESAGSFAAGSPVAYARFIEDLVLVRTR